MDGFLAGGGQPKWSNLTTLIIPNSGELKNDNMKTIEERAKEHYPKGIGVFTPEGAELLQKAYIKGATEQKAIENKRKGELLEYLEELEAHYRKLEQYDDGKPIRRVIEYIKSMEE